MKSVVPKVRVSSGLSWLKTVPEGWAVKKLKYIADVRVSNVDKKTVDSDEKVRLCNYVDVYRNDYITEDLSLMVASASEGEIEKFSLQAGDVVITKDSESWNDIAVPAFVSEALKNVVCGYHLAMVRPLGTEIDGEFLFRSFQSFAINHQFKISATGITRYGLGKQWIDNASFLVPPKNEQVSITDLLRRETRRIDVLIAKKQAQLDLLLELRTVRISDAVTKGVHESVEMRDSGSKWLGSIPAHWKKAKVKQICSKVVDGIHKTPTYLNSGVPFLTVENLTRSSGISFDPVRFVSFEDHSEFIKRTDPRKGDVLVTKDGTLGVARVVDTDQEFSIFVSVALLRPKKQLIHPEFLRHVIESPVAAAQFEANKRGAGLKHIHLVDFNELRVPLPTLKEQEEILAVLNAELKRIETLRSLVQKTVTLLVEYRAVLITEMVTGEKRIRIKAK